MSNQGNVQQSIRDQTGTELDYNGDWSALFDQAGIGSGDNIYAGRIARDALSSSLRLLR
jgi:hypothetical protein